MSLTSRVIVLPSGLTVFRTNGIYGAQGVNPTANIVKDMTQDAGPGVQPGAMDGQDATNGKDPAPLNPPAMPTIPTATAPAPVKTGLLAGFDITTLLLVLGAGIGIWYFSNKG